MRFGDRGKNVSIDVCFYSDYPLSDPFRNHEDGKKKAHRCFFPSLFLSVNTVTLLPLEAAGPNEIRMIIWTKRFHTVLL